MTASRSEGKVEAVPSTTSGMTLMKTLEGFQKIRP